MQAGGQGCSGTSSEKLSHKDQHSPETTMSSVGSSAPATFDFASLPSALQGTIGSSKRDEKLAKRFVRDKLSKKVQFLQVGNLDMMNKVYRMARTYMKYNENNFASVWTKTVLPAIKSEMNIQRSGYAAAMKNRIIRGTCVLLAPLLAYTFQSLTSSFILYA